MPKVKLFKTNSSTKSCQPNQKLRASDVPYPLERTASGTLYVRLPSGQLVTLDKYKEKGGLQNGNRS